MTLRVDFDQDLWVYVPTEWPWQQFSTLDEWRDALVAALGEAYGYDDELRAWLASTLEGMVRGCSPEEHRFAYLARPHDELALASVFEWARQEDLTRDDILGARDPLAVRPPALSDFDGGPLGTGAKCTRFVSDADGTGPITGVAHWAWRLPDRDIVMIVGDGDLPRFERLQEEFDALARAIGVVSDGAPTREETAR